jgi:hypothetical protein
MLRVKLLSSGKALTPYIARVVTGGRVQKAFAEQIGKPAGACVKASVHAGMAQSAIKQAVATCGGKYAGVKLHLGG